MCAEILHCIHYDYRVLEMGKLIHYQKYPNFFSIASLCVSKDDTVREQSSSSLHYMKEFPHNINILLPST